MDDAADDAAEADPAVAVPSLAVAVRVVERLPLPRCGRSLSCSPTLSESRTTGRGVAGRTLAFAGSDVEALAEGSRPLAAAGPVDASFASAVSVISLVDSTMSVEVNGG